MDGQNGPARGPDYQSILAVGFRTDYGENGSAVGGEYVAQLTGVDAADVDDEIAAAVLAAVMCCLSDCGLTPQGFQQAIVNLMVGMGDENG